MKISSLFNIVLLLAFVSMNANIDAYYFDYEEEMHNEYEGRYYTNEELEDIMEEMAEELREDPTCFDLD